MSKLELLDLPTEILSRIVKCARDSPRDFYAPHLVPDADLHARCDPWDSPVTSHERDCLMKKDLFNLIATCKTLRAVTEPLLYFRLQSFHAPLLLRTFLERPDLAQRVRSLDFCNIWLRDGDLQGLEHGAVDAAADDLGITLPPEWWVEPGPDCEEPHYATNTVFGMLLALVADNLEALFAEVSYEVFVAELIADSSDIELTNLRYTHIAHCDTEGGFDLSEAENLFIKTPKLEHLWINTCAGVTSFLDFDNVRSVRITNSVFNHEALSLLVRACPLLEDFSFTQAGLPEGESHFTPGEWLRVLRPLKGRLRHLEFEPDCNDNYLEWTDQNMSEDEFWIDTLADFEKLETLILPPEYFVSGREEHVGNFINSWGFLELVPPNIKSLELVTPRKASIGLNGKIELVHAVKEDGLFPYLRRFVLDVEVGRREVVKDAFAAVGIEHRVRFLG